ESKMSSPSVQFPSMASIPRVPAGDGFSKYQTLLMAALLALVAFALMKLARGSWGLSSSASQNFRLGPWPVPPSLIPTREDLIQAFEYLSVLRLGPKARTWNHQDIARRLPLEVKSPGNLNCNQAAKRLAMVYEQARYAPLSDPLPEADLAAARNDLCLLAGVAGG